MHFVYLAEDSGVEATEKFPLCAGQSFEDLAQSPLMGTPVEVRRSDLAGFRKWRVRNYEDFLIFYDPLPDRLEIVRVIHGARDWAAILDL